MLVTGSSQVTHRKSSPYGPVTSLKPSGTLRKPVPKGPIAKNSALPAMAHFGHLSRSIQSVIMESVCAPTGNRDGQKRTLRHIFSGLSKIEHAGLTKPGHNELWYQKLKCSRRKSSPRCLRSAMRGSMRALSTSEPRP